MKSLRLTLVALATAAVATTAGTLPQAFAQSAQPSVKATPTEIAQNKQSIGAAELDQSAFILSTNPTSNFGGKQRYGLMIIEQKSTTEPCFSTTGSNPTQVNPLLAQMEDFSGKCGRATDTNGYAIRVNGEQIRFDPVLEREGDVLVLYAKPSAFVRNAEKFVIGQTDGIAANGYTQIFLKPGWRLTRKTVDGRQSGLLYVTNDLTLAEITGQEVVVEPGGGDQSGGNPAPTTPTPPVTTPTPSSFPDVQGDIYASEINRAVQLGFISGFAEDNTFRPRATLTREQLVSIALEGLDRAPTRTVANNPYPDVPANRWSAAKIEQAKDLGLIAGYQDGTFRPTQQVTRAELIAIMNKAAKIKNNLSTIDAPAPSTNFSDIGGHWAEPVIKDLAGYCSIATPLNESGSSFAPNTAAQRNYAAAAMVRLLDCSPAAAAQ